VTRRPLTIPLVLTIGTALLAAATGCGHTKSAGLTKNEYLAQLRAADTRSSEADDAAIAAIRSKRTTAAQVRAAFYAMGKTHVRIGKEFGAIRPPRAATKANSDFAHAERVLGRQNEAIARHLPKTKAAIVKYLQSLQPPSGGKLLDNAIAELHTAGFNIH
jgi:hypothetical protein